MFPTVTYPIKIPFYILKINKFELFFSFELEIGKSAIVE